MTKKRAFLALTSIVLAFAFFNLSIYMLLTGRLANKFSSASQAKMIDVSKFLPFEEDSDLARVDSSLKLYDDLPVLDGAAALAGYGKLLGTVPVNGAGFYDIDITDYIDSLTPGTQVTLLIKNEKAVGNTTIFSYDGETSRPGTLLVSGTVENKVTTLDGNGVIEVGKTQVTASYPLDPFYNNLSYNVFL